MGEAYKAFEDSVCVLFGGRRVLGNRGGGCDSDENVPFSVECKLGYGRFAMREKWLEQARRNEQPGKPWIIVQRPKYARRAVVSLDLLTFAEICQRAGMIGEVEVA